MLTKTTLSSKFPELQVRYKPNPLSKPIASSEDVYLLFKQIWNKNLINIQEQIYVLFLNGNNEAMCFICLNTGTGSQCLMDIKFALCCALKCLAGGIVIAHNHPSGNLNPSPADVAMTKKLKSACGLVDIDLMDHIIISGKGYFSFADEGMV